MAETRETEPAALERLRESIGHAIVATIGEPPNDSALVRPHTVLKTSSGKIRRSATRQVYESGDHESGRRAVWVQMMRLVLASVAPEARDLVRRTGDALYAVWWWLAFAFVAAVVWPLVTLVPAPKFARRILRGGARLFLLVTGAGPTVLIPQRMPKDGPLVIVSNHTSYLDSIVLMATLPRDFCFVAKNSLARSIWTGPFLRHLGTLFVERGDPKQGVEDLGAIAERVRSGGRDPVLPRGNPGPYGGSGAIPDRDVLRGDHDPEPGFDRGDPRRAHNLARRLLVSAANADYRSRRPRPAGRGDRMGCDLGVAWRRARRDAAPYGRAGSLR